MIPPPTDRLTFRAWREDDLELAIALWSDPEVARHLFAAPPSRDEIAERLARELALDRAHGIQYWPIFLRDGGQHVGCCGLRPHAPGVPELGVHLRPAFWGRGLATEAAGAVIRSALAGGATAIFAGHGPDNVGSRRMLLALGFRHTHDEPYAPTGRMHPSYLLSRSPAIA